MPYNLSQTWSWLLGLLKHVDMHGRDSMSMLIAKLSPLLIEIFMKNLPPPKCRTALVSVTRNRSIWKIKNETKQQIPDPCGITSWRRSAYRWITLEIRILLARLGLTVIGTRNSRSKTENSNVSKQGRGNYPLFWLPYNSISVLFEMLLCQREQS